MKEEKKQIQWKQVVALKPDVYGNIYYDCTCECGYVSRLHKSDYHSRIFNRCGPCTREARAFRGDSSSWPYCHELSRIWCHLLKRYQQAISPRWLEFENFLEDIGQRHYGLIIQPINKSELLGKDNWEWASKIRNKNSKRYKLTDLNYTVGDYKLYQALESARKLTQSGINLDEVSKQIASSFGANRKEIDFHLSRILKLPKIPDTPTNHISINEEPSMNWIRIKNQKPTPNTSVLFANHDCSKVARIIYNPHNLSKKFLALSKTSQSDELDVSEIVWWATDNLALSESQKQELKNEKEIIVLQAKLNEAQATIASLQKMLNKYAIIAQEFRAISA